LERLRPASGLALPGVEKFSSKAELGKPKGDRGSSCLTSGACDEQRYRALWPRGAPERRLPVRPSSNLAVLDVNIVGQMIFPVADLIQARGLPFIFATGYGEPVSPKRFQDRPALIKPFTSEALSAAIHRLCAAQSIVRERGAGGEDLLS
jgi:hypothetical protein